MAGRAEQGRAGQVGMWAVSFFLVWDRGPFLVSSTYYIYPTAAPYRFLSCSPKSLNFFLVSWFQNTLIVLYVILPLSVVRTRTNPPPHIATQYRSSIQDQDRPTRSLHDTAGLTSTTCHYHHSTAAAQLASGPPDLVVKGDKTHKI